MEGNSSSTITTLLRGPRKSKQDEITAWVNVTFWCNEISPGPAPRSGAIWSPTATAISHQPSSHARTPRSPQRIADHVRAAVQDRKFFAPLQKFIHRALLHELACGTRLFSRQSNTR